MTIVKYLISFSMLVNVLACQDHKDKHNEEAPAELRAGFSLVENSPYAEYLPWVSTCFSSDKEVVKNCAAKRIPFMGERGSPMTRELIKQHALAWNQSDRGQLNSTIDKLPDELLPLFAKGRVVIGISGNAAESMYDHSAAHGIIYLQIDASAMPKYARSHFPSVNLRTFYLPDSGKKGIPEHDLLEVHNLWALCNAADAYGTHNFSKIEATQEWTSGAVNLSRASLSAEHSYKMNKDLKKYFEYQKLELDRQPILDQELLIAALDDTAANASPTAGGYHGATNDFIDTCAQYLLLKAYGFATATAVFNGEGKTLAKTRKNLIAEAPMKAKLMKMLPAIFADPTDHVKFLEELQAGQELTQDEQAAYLKTFAN